MKTETKKLDKCQVRLTVTLDAEEMKGVVKDVEKAFVREAQLPGFRKGKVPVELIRKEFAEGLKKETTNAMLRKYYADAVKAEKLDEVALADLQNVSDSAEGGSFEAIVEVKPEFKLPTYKGLKLTENDTTVSDQQVADQVLRLREGYAKFENAAEGEAVQAGDYVQIDYAGRVDGKPILEIAPDAKVVASGTGFWTQVQEGRFLKEILDALVGMKAGETKAGVKATFDKEAAPEGLKGAKAEYDVTLKAFRRRILPTDAELVEKTKAESLEKLTAQIREGLEKQAVRSEAIRRENEAVEMLMKKVDFDIPASQVRATMDGVLNEYLQRAQYAGLDATYFEQNAEQIRKDAEAEATKRVRLWYVLSAIAKAENLEAKDDEIGKKAIDFVLANAKK